MIGIMVNGQTLLAWILFLGLLMNIALIRGEETAPCVVNDDYCDCGDDELQSNACSLFPGGEQRIFRCVDNRFFNQSLFLSRVGDGVCDCCDGSDESHTLRVNPCPSICNEVGEEIALESKAFTDAHTKGAEERATILQKTKEEFYTVRSGMRKARKLIPEHRKNILNHRNELIHEEKLEETEFRNILQSSQELFKKYLLNFDIDVLINLLAVITLLTLEEGVEAILVECDGKYVRDGLEPDDSAAFALVKENFSRIPNKGVHVVDVTVGIDGTSSEGGAAVPRNVPKNVPRNVLLEYSEEKVLPMVHALSLKRLTYDALLDVAQHAIARALESNFDLSEWLLQRASPHSDPQIALGTLPPSPISIKKLGYTKNEAQILRNKISHESSLMLTLREDAKDGKIDKNFDYGPEGMFFSLRDRCFSYQEREYSYEICMFKEAKQRRTLIGIFEKYEVVLSKQLDLERSDGIDINYGNSPESVYFIYNNGETCYGTQRPRSIKIKLQCSSGEERISEITEPEICTYAATLLTPLACM